MSALLEIRDYFRRLFSGAYDPLTVLIELLIIGVVVYSTLRFLQGTRGARLMQGIGLVLLLSFVVVRRMAQAFHWERIEFLYQYFVGAIFVMILVVFQQELRRGFMRIGEKLWMSSLFKKSDEFIEPVVTSVAAMSKKRIGALLAIERATGLSGIIDTGVALDAKLTPELLNTIFWPGSALHDMGVVIRSGRVAAAGCQFPLTESDELDRSLGSRHRAAVGLSQESDVVVVVVSEESGAISLARQGQLQRDLTTTELRRSLYTALLGEALSEDVEPKEDTEEDKGKFAA